MSDTCGDHGVLRARLEAKHSYDRELRREMAAWLKHNCGRPDRRRGFWWTEEEGRVVCFVLPEHFFGFSMRFL